MWCCGKREVQQLSRFDTSHIHNTEMSRTVPVGDDTLKGDDKIDDGWFLECGFQNAMTTIIWSHQLIQNFGGESFEVADKLHIWHRSHRVLLYLYIHVASPISDSV